MYKIIYMEKMIKKIAYSFIQMSFLSNLQFR